jgi:hypothetical protein
MNTEIDQQTLSQIRAMLLELNRNESRILYERLKGMLTFHGFLFTSVGVSASNDLFWLAIPIAAVGGLACIPWRVAVRVSYRGAEQLGKQFAELNKQLDEKKRLPPLDAVEVNWWEFRLLPEVALPFAVGFTWILVLTYLFVRIIRG